MKKDALIGAGIVGSAAMVGLFGIIGLGAALLAKKATKWTTNSNLFNHSLVSVIYILKIDIFNCSFLKYKS